MAFRLLSDEELFGGKTGNLGATVKDSATAAPEKSSFRLLSDEELFGSALASEKDSGRTVLGTAGDLVNAASHGVTAAAQGLVGFADLAGGLVGGRGEIGKFLDTNEFSVEHGLRFKDINKKLDNMFQSEAQKAADKRVDAVDGFWNTAVAMGQNPSTILKSVVESLPAMYTGAKAGGAVAFIANKLPAGLEKFAPSIAAKIGTIGDAGAAAIGEGIISGGQTAEQVRSESEDGSITGKQQLISAGSGILTAGLSGLSNKIGAHFGIDDPETAMVRGALRAKNEAAPLAEKGVFRRVLETGGKEGFIEELPQSMQEQMAQNWAQDKPITEGVGKAAAQGAITGFAQGGGHSALSGIVGREKSESTPDSPSRQLAQTAFATVSGDEAFLQQQQRDRASIALALSQLDDEELKTATTHLAGGNEQLQQLLQQSARDPETVKNYNNVVGRGSVEYVEVSDQIRRDSGITVDNTQETPTAPAAVNSTVVAENQSQTTAVDPTVGTNSAGFKTEPIAQLQAQLLALADGRKPGVVMGVQEANQLRDSGALDGFAQGEAIDPNTGATAVFVGKDNEAVNAAVTRASEVGLKQAAGEFLQYANPTATTDVPANASVVQQVDDHTGHVLDEQIVTPEQAANIKRIPGTSVRTVPVSQALYERTQSVQNEQSTAVPPVSQPQEQSSVPQADQTQQGESQAQAPAAEVAPLRQQTTETSTATPRMQSWVDSFNASKGIAQDSDQQVDASSIREFAPQKGSALSKIAAAVKEAFGVSVVFVETPHGGLMRKNGNKYNSFNGFVDLRNKSLVLNVDAATPLNTLGHELAHLLKVSFPDIYGKLELSVLSRMSYKQAKEFKEGLQKALDQEGDKASIEQEFRDEAVAEALGEMTQDQAFWSDVFDQIGEDEAKAKTLYDTVMQVLAKLAKAFTKNKFIPGVKDMQKVRRAATDAFIEWSARIENPNNLGPESLKAFKQTQSEGKAQEAPKAESVHMFGRDFPKTLEDNDPLLQNTVEINTPERIALRNQIIDSHFEGRAPVYYGKPSITMLGGGGGVGKSTVLKFMQRVLQTVQMDDTLVKINSDDIKVILPEYQQIREKKDWRAATTVHAESSLIAKAIQYRALGMTSDQVAAEFKPYMPTTSHGKYDILLDATMSDAKKGKALVEDANGRGYHVKLIAVVANPESAIERAYERGKKSGRFVPDEVVAEAHAGFLNAIEIYSNVVDDFSLWDNDVPLNSPAIQKGVNDEQYRQTIAGYAAAAQRLGATSSGQTGNAATGGKESAVAGSAGGQRQAGEGTGQEQSQHGLAGGLTQFSRESIQRAIDGERTGPLLVSKKPPAKLAKFLDSLPVTISDRIIRKVASGKKGDRPTFTAKQIESLTQLLENPAAVFQSASREDSIVVLTNLVVNGEPVIAAIERGSNRTYTVDITPTKSRQIEFNSNAINSSYPKDLTGIRNWIASGRLLQWDKSLTGKPGFPQTVHAWLAQGARFMGKPVPALKTESAGTLDKVDAPIAPTVQQNQPKVESVQKPASIVNEKNALTLKKTSFGRIFDVPLSTTKLMGMPDEEARRALGLKASGKGVTLNKVRKIGEAINAAIHREGGLENMMGKRGVMTENAIDRLSNAMVDEVMYQLAGKEDTGSGRGWYSSNYPNALKRLSKRFPELAHNEDARTVFTALVAVTSNGEKVGKNIRNAVELYSDFRMGKPLVAMGNRRATALEKNLVRIQKLIDEHGIGGLRTELMKETTVSEMNAALRAMGEKIDGSYKADTVVPRAAIYFGPKLGAFYANLMGAEGYLTMDLWWSRTINRMRGMLVPKATPSSIQTFREIIGDPSLTDDQVIAASEDVGKRYKEYNYTTELEYLTGSKESKYPGGSEAWLAKAREATGPAYEQMLLNHRAEKAANNIYKPEFLELQEAPFNASDRESMYAAARMTQSKLEDKGIKLSLADIQAALWYYEKRLYQKLSGRKADDIGYEEAIVAQADEAGGRAGPSVRFHRGNDAGIESVRGGQKADTAIKRNRSSEATKGSGQSVTFEVAPSPDNKELHDRWQALPDAKKTDISLTIGKKYVEKALSALGMRGSIEVRIGSYIDATTPSFTASLEDGGDPMMLAGFMGYVLSQKEMMVTSDKPFNGGEERGAVTLTLPDGLTISEIDAIYQDLRTLKNKGGESVVGGQTTSGNQMAILNFSEYSGEQLTTEEMALRIDAHLGGRYTVHYDNVFSAMPGESDYNYDSNQQNGETIARRPSLQGDASSLRIQATADLAAALGATNFSRTEDAAPAARLAEPAGRPSIGSSPSQRGSTVSQAIHYGKQAGLSNLSGSSFGTGIKGAELERLNKPGVDPRIKKRVYFYLPVEGGIPASESGLGGNVYSADLKNMYDPDGSIKGEGNAFESAVLDAGYKGYLNRMQGTAVVLNSDVPVRYLGTSDQFNKVQRMIQRIAPKVETRTEGNESVRKMDKVISLKAKEATQIAAPSFKQQYGEARVATDEKNAANEALEAEGSDFRFSRRTDPDPVNTVTAYKLFRMDKRRPGQLFPLFVDANTPVPIGTWLDAEEGEMKGDKVKSKIGPLAYRPGWHAGDTPLATHIGEKSSSELTKPDLRPDDHVWAEVEMAADRDWQTIANERGTNKDGRLVPVKAHITDQIPVDGFYRYKTNSNMTGNWMIGGSIKVTRILSDAEVARINNDSGVADLPRKRPLNLNQYGFDASSSDTRFSRNQTETPQFKKWFGGSKVVDADGKPLVVYHGTDEDFTSFKGTSFFTDNKDESSEYGGRVMKVYLSIRTPKYMDSYDQAMAHDRGQIERYKKLGYDGFIGEGSDGTHYVTFYPTQIKSATGNNGEFDGTNPDIRFSRNATKLMTAQEMEVFAKTGKLPYKLGDAIRRLNFADAFMLAKDKNERQQLLNDIGDSVIHSIMDGLIPVQRWIEKLPMSNLFRQRLQGDMRRADTMRSAMEKEVKQKFAEEMYKAIEDVSKQTKFTTDQIKKFVGSWMTAKYAPKANRHLIAKDRKALIEAQNEVNAAAKELAAAQQARVAARMPGVAGSVVSAAALRLANAQKREADAIPKLADARRELAERLADVNSAAGTQHFVRGVAGGLNDAMAASIVSEIEGKIDPQLLAAVAKPAYAMLAWKKNLDLASGKVTQTMVNSWPNHADYVPLTGDPRYDKDSSDVFQYGNQLNQDSDKEMNGRKDSIADDGLDAAFTAVMKSINFSAFQDFKRSLNTAYESAQRSGQDIGLTREPITGIMRNSDDVIIYRDATSNGMKAYALKFKDQAIIEAIKKANHETLNRFLHVVAVPTRWYGRLVTQFAPAFAPINFIRDLWERSEFLRVRDLYDQSGNKVDVDKAARASIAYSLDPNAWKASAQVNFETSGTSPLRATLERFLKVGGSSTWGDYLAKSASNLESDIRGNTGTITRGVNNAVEKVHAWNNMFEMVAPLSIFRALLDQNMSEKDAAAATLDLMNFRKRGTAMPGIRALWVFAQPAATSGYNLAQYLSTKKGQKRFAAQLLLGTVLYALLRGAWGDDDDEELGNKLDNLSNFTVERSIPIKVGDMMVKVPVGFGAPQLAWAMAGILNRWNSGRYDASTALLEGAKAWTKSVSPINPSDLEISKRPVDFMATTIVPTVFRPILNIFADQTGLGSPLTPQFKNDKKMNWEQAMRTTPQLYTDMAEALHEMTGWDVFPDHIKALSDGYMIGPMREIMSHLVDNPAREMRGEKTRIPLVASLVDNIRDRQLLNNVYYRERDAIAGVAKEYESRMARNDLADWITPEKTQQLVAFKQFKSQELMFGHMRNNLVKAKLDPETRSIQLQAIEEQADNARRRVLVTFLQNKEKP